HRRTVQHRRHQPAYARARLRGSTGNQPEAIPDVSPPCPRAQGPAARRRGIDFGDRRGDALGLLPPKPFRCRIQGAVSRVALRNAAKGALARLAVAHPWVRRNDVKHWIELVEHAEQFLQPRAVALDLYVAVLDRLWEGLVGRV